MTKRWLVVAVAVPIVLVAAVAGAAWSFDPNSQKARLVEAVQRATGRELVVAGPIRLGWSLVPTLEAQDVSLANMPGGSRPAMATAARIKASIRLWPLLFHRVELARVTLVRPDILLETNAGGHGNWQFQRLASPVSPPPDGTPAAPGNRTTTVLNSLAIKDGRVTWRDGVTGRSVAVDVSRAALEGGEGPLHLAAQAHSAGLAITLDAALGTMAQVTGQAPGPSPLRLKAVVGDATLAVDGLADPAARSLSGRVEASVPDLAQLAQLFQRPDWPALHDVHLAATLPVGGGMPQDLTLQLGAADLGRMLPGAVLGSLALTWHSGQGGTVKAEGSLAGAPWHLASGLVPTGAAVALRGLTVASALGDLAGDVAMRVLPRPELRGTLVSRRLDLDAIPARLPAQPGSPPPGPAPPTSPPPASPVAPAWLVSDAPLPWAALRLGDADLLLAIGMVHARGADYRNVTAHIVLQDGVLRIDPASLQAPEGRIDGSASADARQAAPPVALVLRSGGFALQPLAQAFGLPGDSQGSAELDVALRGAGLSPRALAAGLDGHVGIALVDGEVANATLAAALGDVVRSAGVRLDANGRSHVRCLAIRATAQAGQVSLPAFELDTSRLLLEGGGTLDLATETMALRLRPVLRLGGAGVSAAIRIDGPWRHPTIALDAGESGRVGVVIGGGGPADGCTAALVAARDGRTGAVPAATAAGKGAKPVDLLRSLLR